MPAGLQAPPTGAAQSLREATQRLLRVIADRTSNTSHPDYDARLVHYFPGAIVSRACANPGLWILKKLATGDEVSDVVWQPILADVLAEAPSVPHAK